MSDSRRRSLTVWNTLMWLSSPAPGVMDHSTLIPEAHSSHLYAQHDIYVFNKIHLTP